MIFNIEFWNIERYLPTKRHRVLRERYVKNSVDVEIKELGADEFPIAFIVHDEDWRYEEGHHEAVWSELSMEIRVYNGKLWKATRFSDCVCRATNWMPVSYIKNRLENYKPFWTGGADFSVESIIKEDNIEECKESIVRNASNFVIFDNKVWEPCGEPMYVINTFGLGHNHGGTGFFIQYYYNSNISNRNYFNALERDKAIAYGKQVALNRGDTKSVEGMGEHDIIEVLMPEMVKRNPQQEHGEGDAFINSVEKMISGTNSSMEAGLLAMTMCMREVNK